ncbi:hypothetical protein EVAR_41331_1 [Eumeta japonica]|uniref:Uncharacterized protein n=1 Tax=Eumeta variegata TaxID=151549 RepID=A0A4C1X577_EUMVA|nr:hypothetical protein EVAR_41331_1 [Eumeta japonica]
MSKTGSQQRARLSENMPKKNIKVGLGSAAYQIGDSVRLGYLERRPINRSRVCFSNYKVIHKFHVVISEVR